MVAKHAIGHEPLHVDWRVFGSLLLDVAEALWLLVSAMFWTFVTACFFGLAAFGLKQQGQWAAGVMTIVIGFALIVYALIVWMGRQTMQHVQAGHQTCPWCTRENVRLTTRVIGHPRPGIITLVDAAGIDVCGECAPDVIDTALREHQFSSAPVEVLPLKQVA